MIARILLFPLVKRHAPPGSPAESRLDKSLLIWGRTDEPWVYRLTLLGIINSFWSYFGFKPIGVKKPKTHNRKGFF